MRQDLPDVSQQACLRKKQEAEPGIWRTPPRAISRRLVADAFRTKEPETLAGGDALTGDTRTHPEHEG